MAPQRYLPLISVTPTSLTSHTLRVVASSKPTVGSSSTSSIVVLDLLDLSSSTFNFNEEIMEALSLLDYPWDDMHHHAYFLP